MKKVQWMMGVAMVLLMAQAGWATLASSQFKISAQKKTVAKNKSETQQLPRGSTHLEESKVVYQFEIDPKPAFSSFFGNQTSSGWFSVFSINDQPRRLLAEI